MENKKTVTLAINNDIYEDFRLAVSYNVGSHKTAVTEAVNEALAEWSTRHPHPKPLKKP